MRISIEQYVAVANPKAASQLLVKYGVPAANDLRDLCQKLEVITYKYRDLALNDLSTIDTPYRRLILDNQDIIVKQIPAEVKSNCDGCGGTCGDKKSNVEGDKKSDELVKKETKTEEVAKVETPKVYKIENSDKYDKYIMPTIAVVGIVALAFMLKNK